MFLHFVLNTNESQTKLATLPVPPIYEDISRIEARMVCLRGVSSNSARIREVTSLPVNDANFLPAE